MPGITARRWPDHFGPRPGGRRAQRYADPAGSGPAHVSVRLRNGPSGTTPGRNCAPSEEPMGAACPAPGAHYPGWTATRQTDHRSATRGRATPGRATPGRATLGRATLGRATLGRATLGRARLRPEAAVRLARCPTTASPPRAPNTPSARRRAAAAAAGAGRLRRDLALVDA